MAKRLRHRGRKVLRPSEKSADSKQKDVLVALPDAWVWTLILLQDAQRVLSTASRGAVLWDLGTGKTLRRFHHDTDNVYAADILPDGRRFVTAGQDGNMRLFDLETGELLKDILAVGPGSLYTLHLLPDGRRVLCGGANASLFLRDLDSGEILCRYIGHTDLVRSIDVLPDGRHGLSASYDNTIRLWDLETEVELRRFVGHGDSVQCIEVLPDGKAALSGSSDRTLRLWDIETGAEILRLDGHEGAVRSLAVLSDGKRALSGSHDRTIRLWDLRTGAELRRFEGHTNWVLSVLPLPDGERFLAGDGAGLIRVWQLSEVASDTHLYTTARVALLGDSGVGKTGLGWRIAHGAFRDHPSTHGQQFWVVDRLGEVRSDGTQCETVLWDLAGQPDYRLVHALFLDNVDLGLLLFDPANREKPLSGVEYWIKHLGAATLRQATTGTLHAGDALASTAPTLLIAARSDRGAPTLTDLEIEAFCKRHGIAGYVRTSALENIGIEDLMARIKTAIPWHRLTPTVTTDTFKRIKDHILRLKETGSTTADVLLPADDLRGQLQATDPSWRFDDAEMLTAVQHLANHGYVALIQRADGGHSILLASDLLVNLASSVVLEARRHERGLGMLDEARLLAGDYALPELSGLPVDHRRLLLDEAVRLFLRRNLCFRETVTTSTSLVFPSLINEKRPGASAALIDDVTYRIAGEVETVYPALVVQLGYTSLFRQEHHWQTQAEYELEPGQLCGFRQTAEGDGEIELVLSYSLAAGEDTRMLFRGLFERFLKRRRVQVSRLPTVTCSQGHPRTAEWSKALSTKAYGLSSVPAVAMC